MVIGWSYHYRLPNLFSILLRRQASLNRWHSPPRSRFWPVADAALPVKIRFRIRHVGREGSSKAHSTCGAPGAPGNSNL
jgi:hypothetical protein